MFGGSSTSTLSMASSKFRKS